MLFDRHKCILNCTYPVAPRHGGRCGLRKNGWGALSEIFGSCSRLAAEGKRLEGQGQSPPLLFSLVVFLKVTSFPDVSLFSKKHSSRSIFTFENVVQSPIAELAFGLCSLLHIPHLTFQKNYHKRVPTCRSSESVTQVCVLGAGVLLSSGPRPPAALLPFKPPLLPLSHVGTTLLTPATTVENHIDILSFGNIGMVLGRKN